MIIIIALYILRRLMKKTVYLVDMITRDRIIWNQKTKKISLVEDFDLCLNEVCFKKLNFEFLKSFEVKITLFVTKIDHFF